MTEIDILNNVKFTDGNGVMHLFPEEEEGDNNFLPFRYVVTDSDLKFNKHDHYLRCPIRERVFFIPDNGVNIYKDLYILNPLYFLLIGNGYHRDEIEKDLKLLGYSKEEIESKVKNDLYICQFTPSIIADGGDYFHGMILLKEGLTYVDAIHGNGLIYDDYYDFYEDWEDYIRVEDIKPSDRIIWSPDLMKGISAEKFFGDKKDWQEMLEEYAEIRMVREGANTEETAKIVTR